MICFEFVFRDTSSHLPVIHISASLNLVLFSAYLSQFPFLTPFLYIVSFSCLLYLGVLHRQFVLSALARLLGPCSISLAVDLEASVVWRMTRRLSARRRDEVTQVPCR